MPDIVFYSDSWVSFNSKTLSESPLGGSETALVMMAQRLAERGHTVSVYNHCKVHDYSTNVKYRDVSSFESDNIDCDIFISCRSLGCFSRKFAAKKTIYWMQDNPHTAVYNRNLLENFPKAAQRIDKVFAVSEYQKKGFLGLFPDFERRLVLTRNGSDEITMERLRGREKNPGKFIYATTPFRGLSALVQMWPYIKKLLPSSELHIYGGMGIYHLDEKNWQELYDKAAATEGIFVHGSLPQPELAHAMSDAMLFLYPNTFDETSCISAMNSISLGVPVITTKRGALPETVKPGCGILIEGNPITWSYKDEFIKKTENLAKDRQAWGMMHKTCLKQDYSWKGVADQWEKVFEELLGKAIFRQEN